MTRRASASPLPWLGGLLALYLLVPVVAFLVRLAGSNNRGFGTAGLWGSLYVSVATATISTALVALFGIPLAYVLAKSKGRFATIVGVLVQLPLALPPLMAGIVLVSLVGPYTTLGRAFGRHLTDTMVGVVLAQSFVAAPFLIVAARSAFAAVDGTLAEHAASLGHKEWARFWRVSLPLAGPGIRAGLLLTWLRAFGEYGATVVLAYHPYTLPVYTYVQFSSSGVSTTQAPTALALITAVIVATLWQVPRRRRRGSAVVPEVSSPPRLSVPTPVACDLDVRLGTFRLLVSYSAHTHRLAVLGPSGAGKSATLRALAGLLGPAAGSVSYRGVRVDQLPVETRSVSYVPQGYGLFPHMTVWQQICFGVGADEGLAAHWLARLHISGLENRVPAELSGGQRQRVALAQALARSPDLLLLDEPFSALDVPVRHELRAEMRSLQRETDLSTVLVTHDPEEAAYLADEIIVLSDGRVLQSGTREEVFARPQSPEVARLIGFRNLVGGRVGRDGEVVTGRASLSAETRGLLPGTDVIWSIRPERVWIGGAGPHEAVVLDCADLGAVSSILLDFGGLTIEARSQTRDLYSPGTPCRVTLPSEAIRVWPAGRAEREGRVDPERHLSAGDIPEGA